MRHYACAILLRDGLILLGKRSPHRKAYPNCWDVIGGRVEEGETLDAALHRELGEEIGITPVASAFLCSVVDNGPQERGEATYHMHLVRDWSSPDPVITNHEHTALTWFPIEEACQLPDLALAEYVDVFKQIRVSPGDTGRAAGSAFSAAKAGKSLSRHCRNRRRSVSNPSILA